MKNSSDYFIDAFVSKTKMVFLKELILRSLYPNPSNEEADFLKLVDAHMQRFINCVFFYAETDVERLFLNSLFLQFSRESPYFMTFINPLAQASEGMISVSQYTKDMVSAWKAVLREFGEITPELLIRAQDTATDRDETTKREMADMTRSIILFNLYNKFHLSMKSTFTDILIEGQYFKADVLIWLPSKPKFKLIIESDGFGSFSRSPYYDANARDDILQSEGFQILRFSGEEIADDPDSKSDLLYRYLLSESR